MSVHPQATLSNLLCAQANSASYPQRDGKRVVAHGLRGEGLVRWLGRWYVCVLHRGSNCSPSRAMDGRIMCHGIISSCQSAATSEIVKRCCSSLVSSAITSTQTFNFTYGCVLSMCFIKERTMMMMMTFVIWMRQWRVVKRCNAKRSLTLLQNIVNLHWC